MCSSYSTIPRQQPNNCMYIHIWKANSASLEQVNGGYFPVVYVESNSENDDEDDNHLAHIWVWASFLSLNSSICSLFMYNRSVWNRLVGWWFLTRSSIESSKLFLKMERKYFIELEQLCKSLSFLMIFMRFFNLITFKWHLATRDPCLLTTYPNHLDENNVCQLLERTTIVACSSSTSTPNLTNSPFTCSVIFFSWTELNDSGLKLVFFHFL